MSRDKSITRANVHIAMSVSRKYPGKCLHHKGSISWYKNLSNLSGVLGLLDLELPEVELLVSTNINSYAMG